MRVRLSAAAILMLSVTLVSSAQAQQKIFKGKGSAVVIEGDRASAEKLAYQAAVKAAVTEAMRSQFYKGTKDEVNFNLKKSRLLAGALPFIVEEKQISSQLNGKQLNIEAAVAVDTGRLKTYLGQEGILASENKERKKGDFPSVMVIISEEINGSVNQSPYSAVAVRGRLIKNDYKVVDEKIVNKSISHDQAVLAINGDTKTAQAAALQYGSGVIIVGKAVAQASALKSGGMQVYGADISLQAIKADTGKVLGVATASGHFPHINAMTGSRTALEEAAQKASAELLSILEKGFESSTETLVVSVSDINFQQLAILKKILQRDFRQISNISQDNFNGNTAKLDLSLEGNVNDFVDQLSFKDFGTFKIRILNFSPGKIDAVLEMKPKP